MSLRWRCEINFTIVTLSTMEAKDSTKETVALEMVAKIVAKGGSVIGDSNADYMGEK